MAGQPSDTSRAVLADALKTLPAVTAWTRSADPQLAANGAEAVEGVGEWRWLAVRFPIPANHGGGHGYDGTAVRFPTILHLTPDAAKAAWDRGQEVLAAASKG